MQVFHTTATGEQISYIRLGDHAYLMPIDGKSILFLFTETNGKYDLVVYNVVEDNDFKHKNIDALKHYYELFTSIHNNSLLDKAIS